MGPKGYKDPQMCDKGGVQNQAYGERIKEGHGVANPATSGQSLKILNVFAQHTSSSTLL